MQENWKQIKNHPGYLISDLGNVWSIKTGRNRKQNENSAGYLRVQLGAKGKKLFVHRLVAEAFVEGYFDGAVVNHKDLDKHNNKASNLEWVSRSENSKHAYIHGHQTGSFKNKPYVAMSEDGKQTVFESAKELVKFLGFSKSKLYNLLDENKSAHLADVGIYVFPKCLTTNPDECKDVGSKRMALETARHLDDGRYSLISLKITSGPKGREGSCEAFRIPMVMGYHRPVSSFNIGKQGEFAERKYFVESKCKDKLKDE